VSASGRTQVLVLLETREGAVRPAGLEVLAAARRLAGSDGAVVALAPESCAADAAALAAAGADRVLVANADRHSPDGAAATAARVAREIGARAVLLAATVRGRDLQGRIAARLDTGFAGDCIAMDAAGPTFTCPVFAGKALVQLRIAGPVAVVSVRANHFPHAGRGTATAVEAVAAGAGAGAVAQVAAKSSGRPDVAEATRVIAGGRGLGGPENWHLLEQVADAVPGMALGASRAVVDAGWRPHGEQVGQTGKTVAPELYVAVGISGAIQHIAGMSSAKVIVAINRDKEAPIFQFATYGLVGDALEVLPALAAEFRKLGLQ
jgi:electron transfer flavoprotein alpha subunit